MIKGSCCCGAVRFELSAEPTLMGTCHCSRCRKVGASALVFVRREDLKWIAGQEEVRVFTPEAPYKYKRCFCGRCGSALGEILSDEDSFPLSANALDGEFAVRNSFHEFIAEKPSWYEICDDAKQFEGHPVTT
ncbi:GFA family protein [Algicella marina]|uniref:GFA family protein n=1 Tax=Algicella marina TaxID=2683284 RepID=A0A6P1T5G6_9RHOB|nr:GFA family protein [Algicella marina]QHQ37005.1 GFA family protein [Algicella marina]